MNTTPHSIAEQSQHQGIVAYPKVAVISQRGEFLKALAHVSKAPKTGARLVCGDCEIIPIHLVASPNGSVEAGILQASTIDDAVALARKAGVQGAVCDLHAGGNTRGLTLAQELERETDMPVAILAGEPSIGGQYNILNPTSESAKGWANIKPFKATIENKVTQAKFLGPFGHNQLETALAQVRDVIVNGKTNQVGK